MTTKTRAIDLDCPTCNAKTGRICLCRYMCQSRINAAVARTRQANRERKVRRG